MILKFKDTNNYLTINFYYFYYNKSILKKMI